MRMKDVGLETTLIGQEFVANIARVSFLIFYLNFLSVFRAASLDVKVEDFHSIKVLKTLVTL